MAKILHTLYTLIMDRDETHRETVDYCEICGSMDYIRMTDDGTYMCESCRESHTCYECGVITSDVEQHKHEGDVYMLCSWCENMYANQLDGPTEPKEFHFVKP